MRKGERATFVLLWKQVGGRKDAEHDDEGMAGHERLLARAFAVFNVDQVDDYSRPKQPTLLLSQRLAQAEGFFATVPAKICFGGDRAFYDLQLDQVAMPPFEQFRTPRAFYSVLAHELTHWTGAKPRLDRDLSGRFGTDAYAVEELIAELGAAFVSAHLGIGCEPRTDHAPYIASWLRVLSDDPRAIVTAASKAQAVTDYLIALSGSAKLPDEDLMEMAA